LNELPVKSQDLAMVKCFFEELSALFFQKMLNNSFMPFGKKPFKDAKLDFFLPLIQFMDSEKTRYLNNLLFAEPRWVGGAFCAVVEGLRSKASEARPSVSGPWKCGLRMEFSPGRKERIAFLGLK